MKRFTTRFSFEIQDIPAEDAESAARLALKELALRLRLQETKRGYFRIFLGRHEIGRVFEIKGKSP